MNPASWDESPVDAGRADAPGPLRAALRLAAVALGGRCELGWVDRSGAVRALATDGAPRVSWEWLAEGREAASAGVVALRDRDDTLLGGLAACATPVRLAEVAAPLSDVLVATLAEQERRTAHDALIALSSRLHADELNTEQILRLIVERARQLIGVDVTWLGLTDIHDRVTIEVASGARSPGFVDMWIDIGRGIGGLAVAQRRTVVVPDHHRFASQSTDLVIETLAAEGVVSVLCAPLLFEGEAIGALYGGSREPTSFGDTTVAVFTALATQAAVAIVNSRLYGALADQNDLLQRTLSVHRRLDDAALAGADAHAIAGEVARLIQRPVFVERELHRPSAWRYDPAATHGPLAIDPPSADVEVTRVAIRAGEQRLGTIGVLDAAPLGDLERNAVSQGATMMALEIIKEQAAWEAEWRLRGELLEEILQGKDAVSEGLALRAARVGVDLQAAWSLAVLEPAVPTTADLEPIVRTALHRDTDDGRALLAKRGDRVLVALNGTEAADGVVARLLAAAERAGVTVNAGLSCARVGLPAALREAQAALRLARERERPGLVTVEALGPLRHFLDAPGTVEMQAMVRGVLGPLADHDRRRGGELLRTLRAYLSGGGHHPTAAASCHIHPSTLKYRLARIAELLGRPASDPQFRFELELAVRTLDVLGSLGLDHDEVFRGAGDSETFSGRGAPQSSRSLLGGR